MYSVNVILRARAAQALFAWHDHQHLIRLLELFSLLWLLSCALPRLHDYNRRTSDVAHSLDCIPRFRGVQEEVVLAFCKFATEAPKLLGSGDALRQMLQSFLIGGSCLVCCHGSLAGMPGHWRCTLPHMAPLSSSAGRVDVLRQLCQHLRQKRQELLGGARALATDAPVFCVGGVELICSVGLPDLLGVVRRMKDTVCEWPRLHWSTRWTSAVLARSKVHPMLR